MNKALVNRVRPVFIPLDNNYLQKDRSEQGKSQKGIDFIIVIMQYIYSTDRLNGKARKLVSSYKHS